MNALQLAVVIFFTFNALGNIPLFISLLRKYPSRRRMMITLRESLIALVLMLLFYFFGYELLQGIGISVDDVRMGGGTILFLIALGMMLPSLFQRPQDKNKPTSEPEPFIVPLAIPILTGPGTISLIMVYSSQYPMPTMLLAIFLAWIPSALALLFSSALQSLLGEKVLIATERLMGMVLMFIALEMFSRGLMNFFGN